MMDSRKKTLFMRVLLGLIFIVNLLFSQKTIILEENYASPLIGKNLEILEDQTQNLSIDEILSGRYDSRFYQSQIDVPSFGFSTSAYWLRFSVKTNIVRKTPWVLELGFPNIHFIDFYQVNAEKIISRKLKTGIMLPVESRDYFTNHFVFFIQPDQKKSEQIYIRINSGTAKPVALRIFSMKNYMRRTQLNNGMLGILIGIFLIITGFNLFLYISLKDRSFFYFSCFIASLLLFILSYKGITQMFIIPNSFFLGSISVPIFMSLSMLLFLKYSDSFLQMKSYKNRDHNIVNILISINLLFIIIIPFTRYENYISSLNLYILIGVGYVIYYSTKYWRMGDRAAGYFLLSILFLLVSTSSIIFIRFGLLPSNFFTEEGIMFGGVAMVLLMSLALADRIKKLRAEKEKITQDLKYSTERLANVFETSDDFIWELDSKGQYTFVSSGVRQMLGYEPEEILGKSPFDFMPDSEAEKTKLEFSKLQNELKPIVRMENLNRRKDGDEIILETNGLPFFDNDGNFSGYRGIDRDITEKKRYEKLQDAIIQITRATDKAGSLDALFKEIHRIILNIMDAHNFYIALYQEKKNLITFPYCVDEFVQNHPAREFGSGWTEYVLKTGRSHLISQKDVDNSYKMGEAIEIGKKARQWLGVPLIIDDKPIGVMTVQHYQNPNAYSDVDVKIMEFVSEQVAISIRKKQVEDQILILSRSVEQSPAMVIITDLNGTIEYVNAKFTEVTGYTFDDAIGKNPRILKSEETSMNVYHQLWDTLNRGEEWHGEFINQRKNGERYIQESRITPFKDEDGETAHFLAQAEDISQKRRDEQIRFAMNQITEAVTSTNNMDEFYLAIHSQLNELIDATNFFVGLLDEKNSTIILPFIHGVKETIKEAPLKDTLSGYVINQNRPLLLTGKEIDEMAKQGIVKKVGARSKVWLGAPLKDGDKAIGVIVVQSYKSSNAYNQDDLKLLEFVAGQISISLKRKQFEERIRVLSLSVEQSPATVMITDIEGHIEYVNPKFTTSSGYQMEEVLGRNPNILKSGTMSADFYGDMWRTIKSGKEWQGEIQNKKKNGDLYWEFIHISPIINERDEITHFLAVKEDITDRIRMQDQIAQSQKMEAVGTLAGGIAHDFNNLLTVINGYAELAAMKMEDGSDLSDDIQAILAATDKAQDLTKQILGFSRKQIYQPDTISLNDTLNGLKEMIRRLIGEDVEIFYKFGSSIPLIKADPRQIEQVLINLVINGRDAVNQKTEKASEKTIRIETDFVNLDKNFIGSYLESKPGPYTVLAVIDNGVGMTEEIKNNIFEPFFTTKEKEQGTGLGLATVYGIVKQNGGTIYVYSEPGTGSTFKIYWPVSEKDNIEKKNGYDDDAINYTGNETILFVEDDAGIQNFARSALEKYGYKVLIAENGRRAIQLMIEKKIKINMLVTDMIMPEMNGKELADEIRKNQPLLPVLFVSGYTDTHIVNEGELNAGINFLQKPYSVHALLKKIRTILDSGEAQEN